MHRTMPALLIALASTTAAQPVAAVIDSRFDASIAAENLSMVESWDFVEFTEHDTAQGSVYLFEYLTNGTVSGIEIAIAVSRGFVGVVGGNDDHLRFTGASSSEGYFYARATSRLTAELKVRVLRDAQLRISNEDDYDWHSLAVGPDSSSSQDFRIERDGELVFEASPPDRTADAPAIDAPAPSFNNLLLGTPSDTIDQTINLPAGDYVFKIDTETASQQIDNQGMFTIRYANARAVTELDLIFAEGFGPCSGADWAEPYNVISQADVAGYVDAWFRGDPRCAALAAPFDVVNQADVSAFVSFFFQGCPS